MLKRLVVIFIVLIILPALSARAQTADWFTYTDLAVGYAFEYPADARLTVEGDAVFVALNQPPPFQGYALIVFDNPADGPLDRYLIEQRGLSASDLREVNVGGVAAVSVSGEPDAYWLQTAGAVIKFQLIAAADGLEAATGLTPAAFDRALQSFRSVPRAIQPTRAPIATVVPLALRPTVAEQFRSPFNLPTTTQFRIRWNIITSDTRYGIRNLGLPGAPRKCFNVTWPRMLHSGMDLYRANGFDTTGLPVYAVADGQVAFYDPAYASYPGRVVILSHTLRDGRVIYSVYAHLGSVSVTPGQFVAIGQPLGTILYQPGDSHLHFEMRWFLDGHNIYLPNTSCNSRPSFYYGRGYTYLIQPDNFPATGGYVNPDAFIQAHGGPALTPIGLPDPYTPTVTLRTLSQGLALSRGQSIVTAEPAVLDQPIATTKTLTHTLSLPIVAAEPALLDRPIATTKTLTHTLNLPLIARTAPRLEPACIEGQDLLSNGGFEAGPGSAPWMQVRTGNELISNQRPAAGTYGLWLGGRNVTDEEALQAFSVPYYTAGLTVTFKRLLTTEETDPVVYDHFEIVIENSGGNEVSPPITLSNLSPAKGIWVSELAAFSGFEAWGQHRLRLSLKGMSDTSLVTSLYMDEVSVQTRCAP